jgi:hypothetical protein
MDPCKRRRSPLYITCDSVVEKSSTLEAKRPKLRYYVTANLLLPYQTHPAHVFGRLLRKVQ